MAMISVLFAHVNEKKPIATMAVPQPTSLVAAPDIAGVYSHHAESKARCA